MDYLLSMFRGYMRDYGIDCVVNGSTTTRIFFKEIKDNQSKDTKYLYAYNGEVVQGDLIDAEDTKWLILQEDTSYHKQYTRFVVVKANNQINFVINESLYTTNGVIDAGNQTQDSSRVSIIDGKIVLTIQDNEFTKKIATNNRIIKFGHAWKVIAKTNESSHLFNVFCESDTLVSDDDVINEIPVGVATWGINFTSSSSELNNGSTSTINPVVTKNGTTVTEGFTLVWESSDELIATVSNGVLTGTGIGLAVISATILNKNVTATIEISVIADEVVEYRIIPEDREVFKVYGAMTYFINKYINGVVVADTFTITASGLTTADYTFVVLNGNSFKLTSKLYANNPVTVRCVSNSDGYIHEELFYMRVM